MEHQEKELCPVCRKLGRLVSNQTVRCVLKKDEMNQVGYYDFFLCYNATCRVGYFNNDIKQVIGSDRFLKPIWFKTGSKTVYACYCRNITKQEVVRTVLETNLNDRYSIILYLRGEVPSSCHISNPSGQCCDKVFIQMIDEALKIKKILLRYQSFELNSIQINKKALEQYSVGVGASKNSIEDLSYYDTPTVDEKEG